MKALHIFERLAFLLAILLTSIGVSAQDFEFVYNGTTLGYYVLSDEGTCSVARSYNPVGDVVVPAYANGYKVVSIGCDAFWDCDELLSVTLPETLDRVEDGAFVGCPALEAFYGKFASDDHRCLVGDGRLAAFAPAGVTEYTIPNSVTSIGIFAFGCCDKLESVTIPETVTCIDNKAFNWCSALKSITIPESVKEIGDGVFWGCTSLSAFYGKFASADGRCLITKYGLDDKMYELKAFAPAGLTEYTPFADVIGCAFTDCDKLTDIDLPYGVKIVGAYAFAGCSSLKSICFPPTVKKLERDAFRSCTSMTTVVIPKSVGVIESYAFANCSALTSIFMQKADPTEIRTEYDCFSAWDWSSQSNPIYSNAILYVPTGSMALYEATEPWRNFKHIEELDDPTAIHGNGIQETASPAYNLQGVRIGNAYKGIVIKSGKKCLRK